GACSPSVARRDFHPSFSQEPQRANRVAAFRAQRSFENEGRKSRLATLGEQAPREPRVVMAHKGLVKRMVRVAGLDQYFARQVRTAGTPRYLLQLGKGPLARPIVAREQAAVGIEH